MRVQTHTHARPCPPCGSPARLQPRTPRPAQTRGWLPPSPSLFPRSPSPAAGCSSPGGPLRPACPLPAQLSPPGAPRTARQTPGPPASPRRQLRGRAGPAAGDARAQLASSPQSVPPHQRGFFALSPPSPGIPCSRAGRAHGAAAQTGLAVLAASFRSLLHLYLSLSLIYDLSAPVDTVFHTAYIVGLHCNIRRISPAGSRHT